LLKNGNVKRNEASKHLDIQVLGNMIITKDDFYSFSDIEGWFIIIFIQIYNIIPTMTLQEPIDIPIDDFKKHIKIENNYRIFFSGKFGIGKTYFLNKYFEKDEESVKIHLFPVNYAIANNEDIFDLIRYDILYELMNQSVNLEKETFSIKETLPNYLNKNFIDILLPFIIGVPKVGKSVYSIIEKLKAIKDHYLKEHKELQIDDMSKITAFTNEIESKSGSIYSYSFIDDLIFSFVNQLKGDSNKKKVTLIIDDLDRIDPEHIFRILNVFSAHFDLKEASSNKFNFDKVILVGDISNIKSIFHHKYGRKTDFEGYIDKFYSEKIYLYDNQGNINKIIKKVLEPYATDNDYNTPPLEEITEFIKLALKHKKISLRSLLNHRGDSMLITEKTNIFHSYKKKRYKKSNFTVLYSIEILVNIFDNIDTVISALESFQEELNQKTHLLLFNSLVHLLPVMALFNNELKELNEKTYLSYIWENNRYSINFDFVSWDNWSNDFCIAKNIMNNGVNSGHKLTDELLLPNINHTKILLSLFKTSKELGIYNY